MSAAEETPAVFELQQRLTVQEAECRALRLELEEAKGVVDAIRRGEIDALLVSDPEGAQVFTLEGADQPYRIMVESMSEGAATLVADGTLAYANSRLAALLGMPLERLLGQPFADFVAPAERARFAAACTAARSGQHVEEFAVRGAGGCRLPALIALSPLRQAAAAREPAPALCLVVTDLTESQRNADLTLAISRREAAEAELRLAVRQKDAFLAMLAHELRNPLSPIRHASELLTRSLRADPRAQSLVAMIARQTEHLSRLVDDLLDVARIAQNRIVLKKGPVEIGSLIDQAVETVQAIISEKGHRLRVDKPKTPLYVHGDRARLAQSLSNLLHNAAKYTDPGGAITVTVAASAGQLELEVRDSGIGIADSLLPHVFDLFVQSERTLDRAQGGLGIGLSIVKGLVEMHGGTVHAASAGAQSGSTFTISLPLIAPPETARQECRPLPAARRRVLIVDDNVDAADSLALLLESDGHEAQTAYSASTALEAVERLRPEVVLLDVGLPHIDGYEVARRLRARASVPGMRLIALTGYGRDEDRERARQAGFDDHLLKPADIAVLQQLLT
ncbi:MAG: response regulator [Gammaproteobacteria bacterium]|nr:response regulator [Gammaproteobacteria bacterium]